MDGCSYFKYGALECSRRVPVQSNGLLVHLCNRTLLCYYLQRNYSECPLFSCLMDKGYCRQQVQRRMDSSSSSMAGKDLEKLLRYSRVTCRHTATLARTHTHTHVIRTISNPPLPYHHTPPGVITLQIRSALWCAEGVGSVRATPERCGGEAV